MQRGMGKPVGQDTLYQFDKRAAVSVGEGCPGTIDG